jgi:hypothetical protein
MRWEGYLARMGTRAVHVSYWLECQKERDNWEDRDVGEWIILRWILRDRREILTVLVSFRIGISGELL